MSETIDWQKFEELILKNGIFIDRPKGTPHPRYSNRIYPMDYGYIKNTVGTDGEEIDVFVGKEGKGVVGIIKTEDSVKHDTEIKILWNMSIGEAKLIESFLNFGGMKAKLIWRY
ncbi:inorganic pyrophosphatase [Candidatus Marsarchaeota archaeon]|jgi:inorganic pyrophosphatase|nr:inorganic pyrophosphatase [Candidatus Marsarchaeota archaeon]